ncbi:MAG: dimethyl sulfoxide reductase anchor subunit, partial [Pseudomonadota bacterium]|nr:dimethyl sulfoxide reductase anchor subunit [Pseudomonadota bacterium]
RVCFFTYFLIPIILTGLTSNADSFISISGTLLAAVSVSVGVVVERWLFFAEAKHVSMLYYGAETA